MDDEIYEACVKDKQESLSSPKSCENTMSETHHPFPCAKLCPCSLRDAYISLHEQIKAAEAAENARAAKLYEDLADDGIVEGTLSVEAASACQGCAEEIRSLISEDQNSALEAVKAQVREECAAKIRNFRAHLNFEALLDAMRDEQMPPKAVEALSNLLDGLADIVCNGGDV